MWGAIIGDLAGSIYEYEQTREVKGIKISNDLIPLNAFYSDDTILTVAVLDAIISNKSYEEMLRKYGKEFINYKPAFTPYFKKPFSPGFVKWLNGDYIGNSTGNGAMMRISPVGYLFTIEEDVIDNAKLATNPSHNTPEAIECAVIIARIIFMARRGYSKDDIIKKINLKYKYEPFITFNTSCLETINNCLCAVFSSQSFDESIRKILSYGGDTDTNACIVGSLAEALYDVDKDLVEKAKSKLPEEFVKKIELGYNIIRK